MTQGPPGRENAKFTRAFMVDGTTGSNCCFTSLVKGFYRPLREFSLWPFIQISELPGNREAVRRSEAACEAVGSTLQGLPSFYMAEYRRDDSTLFDLRMRAVIPPQRCIQALQWTRPAGYFFSEIFGILCSPAHLEGLTILTQREALDRM